ncbi:MAG: ATP phosphoribosyltransferase regulatory subunit [Candidatus Sungbacteria bacterium]|nr:ATP phosphoribosyltransferase regulatory subunit [Candidatus Sungbacteria bacterium]
MAEHKRKTKPEEQELGTLGLRLPLQERTFVRLREIVSRLSLFYGFEATATPILDSARAIAPLQKGKLLEERGPILCKMRDGEEVALRVSGALSLLRMYALHLMNDLPHPIKLAFTGDNFVSTRSGGERITTQNEWGMTMIGEEGPIAEAEIIQVLWKALAEAGFSADTLDLVVNASGCSQCRGHFRSSFASYFRARGAKMCRNCRRNLKRLPTNVLACEEEKCKMVARQAPQILDFLCDTCKRHLRGVLEFLDEAAIPYFLDSKLFREGSWFNEFLFEIVLDADALAGHSGEEEEVVEMNAASASATKQGVTLAEGGRLTLAGDLIVGKHVDVTAGTLFLDAIERVLSRYGMQPEESRRPRVFLAQLGDLAKRKSLGLMEMLRAGDVDVTESLGRDAMKSQLKVAERTGARIALILGQKEALDETVIVREVDSGIQETVSQEKLIDFLKRKFANYL